MGKKKKNHHCDTIFEEQAKFFTVIDGLLKYVEASGIHACDVNKYSKAMCKDFNHWNNVSDYSYNQKGQSHDIKLTSEQPTCPDKFQVVFAIK
eukprot:13128848-Ditylum_brightwellii.AAC.1